MRLVSPAVMYRKTFFISGVSAVLLRQSRSKNLVACIASRKTVSNSDITCWNIVRLLSASELTATHLPAHLRGCLIAWNGDEATASLA